MNLRIGLFLLLLAVAGGVGAQSAREMRDQAKAKMYVSGHVDIEADGSVSGHVVNERSKYPDYVLEMVDRVAPSWRFEPLLVDGQPVPARARMDLQLGLDRLEDGDFILSITRSMFGDMSGSDTSELTLDMENLRKPIYPDDLLEYGIEGIVYTLIRVGRDGSVEDFQIEQVDLYGYADETTMRHVRRVFGLSVERAVKRWRFTPPTTGDEAGDSHWFVRIPIEYQIDWDDKRRELATGEWRLYYPGPRAPKPDWLDQPDSSGSEALIAGRMHQLGNERRLLTPVDGQMP